MTEGQDYTLIKKCRRNDMRAQKQLYYKYAKPMYNICVRMTGNREDAEDILQEAFISAFRSLKDFRMESSFGHWLKQIVVNRCLDFLRKKRPLFQDLDKTIQAEMMPEGNDNKLTALFSGERIHYAIKELPEGARIIFNLYVLEDYKHREIAKMLNVSESTVKSQYQRARSLLQNQLNKAVYDQIT